MCRDSVNHFCTIESLSPELSADDVYSGSHGKSFEPLRDETSDLRFASSKDSDQAGWKGLPG